MLSRADIPWILSTFSHGIQVFLNILQFFCSLFNMFSGLGTFRRKVVILGFLEPFECRTAHTYQMFRYGWRHFQDGQNFELAFQCHRLEVNPTVRSEVMPILLKSGQSVQRERESYREDEGTSIDGAPLVSIDGDSRTRAEYISRQT